jgi:tetratricopeptide (TPR) repeat protein
MCRKFKALFLIFIFSFSSIYADTESYVLTHDANHYSKNFKKKLMIRIYEKRAHVYTVFGKYDLAISYLNKAEKIAPEKHEFYAYLRQEIRNKLRLARIFSNSNNSPLKIRVKTAFIIKVNRENS